MQLIIPRKTIFVLAILLVVIIAAVVAVSYLPNTSVLLTPKTITRVGTKDIILATKTQEPDFVHFTLPARLVERQIETSEQITRQGVTSFDDFAKGTVTLHNEQDQEQPLLPKTHLRHEASGIFFLTDAAARIPPKGEIKVSVTAEAKGPAGNVAAGKFIIDKLAANLQTVIYGQSEAPLAGGTAVDRELTQVEINQAQAQTLAKLKAQARGELTAEIGGAPIRDELVSYQTQLEEVSAAVGSKSSSFGIHTALQARAFVVDENDVLSLTLLALRGSAGTNEEFISYQPDSFKLTITRADFDRGEAQVKGELTGLFSPKLEPGVFETKNLAGLSAGEVKEYFKTFSSVGDAQITFWPFWVRSVPTRPGATTIEVKTQS